FFVGRGRSGMVYDFHTCSPLEASKATSDARNVQHSYLGFGPDPSSNDATGTYSRPSCNAGAPVTRASGCDSALFVQRSVPVSASTAYTLAFTSPKYAANFDPTLPTLIAVRTPPDDWNDQYTQPVAASSE